MNVSPHAPASIHAPGASPDSPLPEEKNVYQLIAEVAGELARLGISKDQINQRQGYKFRGIDDVYNALAPILAKVGLVILPRCISHKMEELEGKEGKALFRAIVLVRYDFVSIHDGSRYTATMPGEATDFFDKATNKAMSAAYKYNAFQAFCIPTEGDNDADASSHEVMTKRPQQQRQQQRPQQQQQQRPPRPELATCDQKRWLWDRMQAAGFADIQAACEFIGVPPPPPKSPLTKAQFEALEPHFKSAVDSAVRTNTRGPQTHSRATQTEAPREPGEEG